MIIGFTLGSRNLLGQKDKMQIGHSTHLSIKDSFATKILIRSPGNCVHLILFDEVGNGKLIFGTVSTMTQQYTEEFKSFDQVVKEADFKINSKQSLDSIKIILAKVDKISSPHRDDAYRWELFSAGIKKIDEYGKSETIINLLTVLAQFFPFKIDLTCF